MDRWGGIKVERGRGMRHLVTESRGALLFLRRLLVDQSPSVTARKKKKKEDLCARVLMYFTCQNKREREREKKKGGTVLFTSSGTSESRLEP